MYTVYTMQVHDLFSNTGGKLVAVGDMSQTGWLFSVLWLRAGDTHSNVLTLSPSEHELFCLDMFCLSLV